MEGHKIALPQDQGAGQTDQNGLSFDQTTLKLQKYTEGTIKVLTLYLVHLRLES